MARLTASADPKLWVPVTESFGFKGRRHRKAAIRMLVSQANASLGVQPAGTGRFATWAMSQAVPVLMRKAAGRVLVWVYKPDPEFLIAMATIQAATPQVRTARAMRPMEYDDTESFRHPTLGVGEKLVMDQPGSKQPPFVSYTFDLRDSLVELTVICGDDTRLRTAMTEMDDLARSLRVHDDLTVGEGSPALRIGPA